MTEADWQWKFGIIAHMGERAFQVLGDKIRRITTVIETPDGRVMLIKSMLNSLSNDPALQLDASIAVEVLPIVEKIIPDLNRLWSNSGLVIPKNGMRLDK